MRLYYTEDAAADMRSIVRYGVENDLPDPVAYVRELRRRMARLASLKHPGRKGRVPGTREWVLTGTPYIVVYAEGGEDIQVWRVLHGAQQWPPAP